MSGVPSVKKIDFFERYLSLWVFLCIIAGIVLGQLMGDWMRVLSTMELYQVNLPVAILVWLMIYPMMLKYRLCFTEKLAAAY